MQLDTLQSAVRTFYDIQDVRKKNENRVYAMKRTLVMPFLEGKANKEVVNAKYATLKPTLPPAQVAEVEEFNATAFLPIVANENALKAYISEDVEQHPLYTEWTQYVHGIGCVLTGAILAETMDISRFATISKYWQYAGYGIMRIAKDDKMTKLWFPTQEDATAYVNHATELEQKTAAMWKKDYYRESKNSEYLSRCVWGLKYDYQTVASKRMSGLPYLCNSKLKVVGWKCGQQFQKASASKSKYRQYYDEKKAYYTNKFADTKSPGHINNMTLRKVTKLFMSHVWLQWRKLEGLPVSKPYCIDKLDHSHYIKPIYDSE